MNSGPDRSSTFSATKPRWPTTRPRRTRKICTDASSGSSARPTTSKSSARSETICCDSAALWTAMMRSRSRAARSNCSSSLAVSISASSRASTGSVSPERKPIRSLTYPSYASWSTAPTHGPRAAVDVEEQAGSPQPLVARELRVRARADGEAPHEEVECAADGAGVAVGAEVADALALAPPDHRRARPLLVQRDGEPGIALVVLQPDVVARAGAPGSASARG